MENKFKIRVWDNVVKKYLTDDDVYEITDGILNNLYDLLIDENRRFILGNHDLTFEQCTGQRDYKGKLIYVNDILNLKRVPNLYQCVFSHTRVGFDFKPLNTEYRWSKFFDYASDFLSHCTVSGNVHEDSELLEEDK